MRKTHLLLAAVCLLLCRLGFARGWWEESWTATETPYREARLAVDKARNNQSVLSSLVAKWKPQAQDKPFDQVAQYRWGYALYWLTRARRGEEDAREYGEIREALHRATFADDVRTGKRNRSYQFNRLRFWVEHKANVPLWQLGERVLRRNPNDVETQNILLKIWTGSCPINRKAQAVALWRKVSARHRNDPITTYWLASIYNSAYNANYDHPKRDITDLRRANELYRQFLSKAPSTPRYESARHWSKYGLQWNTKQLQRFAQAAAKRAQ